MDGTKEMKCVKCYQPDIPFVWYFVFNDHGKVYQIKHDPYDGIETEYITADEANKRIERFQKAMLGVKN